MPKYFMEVRFGVTVTAESRDEVHTIFEDMVHYDYIGNSTTIEKINPEYGSCRVTKHKPIKKSKKGCTCD